jgi:hypothetical protein
MTTFALSRAVKYLADTLNGNRRRRRQLKARAQFAMLCGKRPTHIRAEMRFRHKFAGHHRQAEQQRQHLIQSAWVQLEPKAKHLDPPGFLAFCARQAPLFNNLMQARPYGTCGDR